MILFLFVVKKNPTAIEDYKIVDEYGTNQDAIQNLVGIQLLKRDNEKTDIARFNVIFAPTRLTTYVFCHSFIFVCTFLVFAHFIRMDCVLVLTIATGGQLKYPIRFVTLDAPPDDEITLEAAGLNKTSTVGFRLYSPTESVIDARIVN